MPMWPAPTSLASTRAEEAHTAHAGTTAQAVASAPGTWTIAGEHAGHYGGIVIMAISNLRAAPAVSSRSAGYNKVSLIENTPSGENITDEAITLDKHAKRYAQNRPCPAAHGSPTIP